MLASACIHPNDAHHHRVMATLDLSRHPRAGSTRPRSPFRSPHSQLPRARASRSFRVRAPEQTLARGAQRAGRATSSYSGSRSNFLPDRHRLAQRDRAHRPARASAGRWRAARCSRTCSGHGRCCSSVGFVARIRSSISAIIDVFSPAWAAYAACFLVGQRHPASAYREVGRSEPIGSTQPPAGHLHERPRPVT